MNSKDELMLSVLSHLDELMLFRASSQNRLSNVPPSIIQAFINLAQAKYILGPLNLSSQQYDLRMQARKTVAITDNGSVEMTDVDGREPIEWFGLLPPACLRKSTEEFKGALEAFIEVQNLNTKIHHFQTLLQQKVDLEILELPSLELDSKNESMEGVILAETV